MHSTPNKLFPLIITDDLARTRAFYLDELGCTPVFDLPGYLQVRFGKHDSGPELCFMQPDLAPSMAGPLPAFAGHGLIMSIPVADADRRHAELVERGVAAQSQPADKPWGWRSFVVADPNGVMLDFFHTLAQAPRVDATG